MTNVQDKEERKRFEEQAKERFLPHLDSAIELNATAYTQVVEAFFFRLEKFNKDPVSRVVYERYYPRLVKAFESKHGAIVHEFLGANRRLAAVRTDKDEIYIATAEDLTADYELRELMHRSERLQVRAQLFLKPPDRETCVEMIYGVVSTLLGILDYQDQASARRKASGAYSRTLKLLKDRLAYAEDYFLRSVARVAQIDYFIGMLWGIAAISLGGAVFGLVLSRIGHPGLPLEPFIGSIVAGGIGGIVSVMSRMTYGGLVLNFEAGSMLLRLLGMFRPIMGSIFGASTVMLVVSGLLPIHVPTDPLKQISFFLIIAFIAGFTERWAQDMLVVAGRRIAADRGEARGDGPEKASSTPEGTEQTVPSDELSPIGKKQKTIRAGGVGRE